MALGEPGGPAGLLGCLVELATGVSEGSLGLLLPATGLGKHGVSAFQVSPRSLLGLLALGKPGSELLALGASRQSGIGSLPRQPAHLAGAGVVALAIDRHGHSAEPFRQAVELVDEPGVGEEAPGDGPCPVASLDQLEQRSCPLLRGLGSSPSLAVTPDQGPRGALGSRKSLPALID